MICAQAVSTCGCYSLDSKNRKIFFLKSDNNISKLDIKGIWISVFVKSVDLQAFRDKLKN